MAAIVAPFAYGQTFTINEVDADTEGSDVLEFIEIYDGGVGNSDLSGLVIVLVNGRDTRSFPNSYDLDGFTTNANGYFVIGTVPEADAAFVGSTNQLENGPDAVALYLGDGTDFPNDTVPTTTNLIDALVYDTDDDDDADLIALFGGPQVNEDGNENKDFDSLQRSPDGTGEFFPALPTPGAANLVPEPVILTISLDTSTILESSGQITATLTRDMIDGGFAGDVDVALSLDDDSEAEISEGNLVTIEDGQESVTVTLLAVDDTFPDGDQSVIFAADPAGGGPAVTATFTVTDDANDQFTVIFNEVNSIAQEDLNGDGLVDGDDDFVEVLNVTNAPIDLTDYVIREGTRSETVHVFPANTILEAGCSIVVGSQGFLPGSTSERFGTTPVQNASEGDTLQITDSGDSLELRDVDFEQAYSVTIPDLEATAERGSYALTVDGDGNSDYAQHADIAATMGALSSPGTMLNGDPFCFLTTPVMVTLTPSQVLENAGNDSVTATVSIPTALAQDFGVFVFSTDLLGISSFDEALAEGTIEAGSLSVDITLDVVDDDVTDDVQTVAIVAGGVGFLNATASVDVLDDGNDPEALQLCDIAFVGYASDDPDVFAFVALTDIAPNTQISFTDRGWVSDEVGFTNNEGIVIWTAPAEGIPALTVVTITNNSPYSATSSAGPAGGSVEEISGGGPNLAASGDQIFAFIGSVDNPILLAGIQAAGPFEEDPDAEITTNSSRLPGVFASTGVVILNPAVDNAVYNRSTAAADIASFKALLFDPANFDGSNNRDDVTFLSASFTFGESADYAVTIIDVFGHHRGRFHHRI